MAKTATGRPHPLLDPDSLYRLGSEQSIWSDRGVGSIRRYFEALRLRELDERWSQTLELSELEDPRLWDWGYDEETNRRIHAARLLARKAAIEEESGILEAALVDETAVSANEFAAPALIDIDLLQEDLGSPSEVGQPSTDMLPGLRAPGRGNAPLLREFWLRLPVGEGQDGRACLVLLLSHGLVEQLAGLVSWQGSAPPHPRASLPTRMVRTQREVLAVLKSALAPEKLEPGEEAAEGERWRGSRLSLVLSCAPGLAGTVSGGLFTFAAFALSEDPLRDFPPLPGATWLVRCLGGRN